MKKSKRVEKEKKVEDSSGKKMEERKRKKEKKRRKRKKGKLKNQNVGRFFHKNQNPVLMPKSGSRIFFPGTRKGLATAPDDDAIRKGDFEAGGSRRRGREKGRYQNVPDNMAMRRVK